MHLRVEFDAKKIDAIFAELDQCHLPGAAIGMAIGGKPVYRKGFGLASMELPVALEPTIRMRIGATTNHFASLAYLLLCEEGRASIDDSIGKYLPELHPITHRITLRQLMGHISGLRDAFEICFRFSGMERQASSAELLSMYRRIDDANAAPGTDWSYNHGGYLMLSAAIERIAAQSLEEVLRERIFAPVGMYDTLLRRLDTDFLSRSAMLHTPDASGGFEKSFLGTALAGEGGMVSTVDDMLLWLAHMDAPVVGTGATWELLKAPQTLANGTATGYGLGLMTDRYRGVDILWHVAGLWGGSAQMLKVPAAGLDIIIMVNRGDVWAAQLSERILDACIPELGPVKEPRRVSPAVGLFRSPATGRVIQLFARDDQQVASIDGTDLPLEADDDGALWCAGTGKYLKRAIRLVGDPRRPDSVRLSEFGNVDELIEVNPTEAGDAGAILGRYRSEATGTEATISRNDDETQLTTVGRFGAVDFQLECLAHGIWRARSTSERYLGGVLSFDEREFRFATDRTRALPFRRCA